MVEVGLGCEGDTRTLEVKMAHRLLTIGEPARRPGLPLRPAL